MDRGRPEDHNLYVSLFVEKFGWKSDEAFMDGPTGTYRLRSQNEFLDNRDCGTTRQRGQPRPGRPAWSFSSQYVEQPDPWIPQQRPARPKSARRPSPGKRSEGTVPGCSTMRADAVRTPGSKHVVGATGCFELRDWVPVMRHGEDPREAAKVWSPRRFYARQSPRIIVKDGNEASELPAVSRADLQDDIDASFPYPLDTTGFVPIEASPLPDSKYTRALLSSRLGTGPTAKKTKRKEKRQMRNRPRDETVAEHEQYLLEKGYLDSQSETETESKASKD